MPRLRLPATPRLSRRPPAELPGYLPPSDDPIPSPRELLLHTWPGRLFVVAASLKFAVGLLRRITTVPGVIEVLSSAATIALILSVGFFVSRLFLLLKRRLLWRVRRKLILSYIFIGVVPALLIIAFFILGAWVVAINVSAYLFRDGYDDVVNYSGLAANAAVSEIARNPAGTAETMARIQRAASTADQRYRALSMIFLPTVADAPKAVRTGDWSHVPAPPDHVPSWIGSRPDFVGTVAHSGHRQRRRPAHRAGRGAGVQGARPPRLRGGGHPDRRADPRQPV